MLPNKNFQGYGGLRQQVVEAIQGNRFGEASTLLQRMNGIGERRATRIVEGIIERAGQQGAPFNQADWQALMGFRHGAGTVEHIPQAGNLNPIAENTWQSPAGLIYGPENSPPSQFRNRVEHVENHMSNDHGRPGPQPHGVFDGTSRQTFALIDEVYQRWQAGGDPNIIHVVDGNRTVILADRGGRIG
ncbi:MAG: hypothetical protein ACRDD1_07050 [Planctomycetia bacterium]